MLSSSNLTIEPGVELRAFEKPIGPFARQPFNYPNEDQAGKHSLRKLVIANYVRNESIPNQAERGELRNCIHIPYEGTKALDHTMSQWIVRPLQLVSQFEFALTQHIKLETG